MRRIEVKVAEALQMKRWARGLEQALLTWFIRQRSNGTPISGSPLLQEPAYHESFKATGWLGKLKNRHGIWNLHTCICSN